jgi:cyclase
VASGFEVVVDGGRTPTGLRRDRVGARGEQRGAGELLVTSIDRDGTRDGFDLPLLRAIRDASTCRSSRRAAPASDRRLRRRLRASRRDAALAASLFHYGELAIVDVKDALAAHGIVGARETVAV